MISPLCLLLVSLLTDSTDAIPEAAAAACESVTIPMCKSMPWNVTSMPNHLHQSSQQNARLSIEQYLALVETNCSSLLTFFLCSMYAPICLGQLHGDPVPPCRLVCETVQRQCEPTVLKYNRTWPEAFSCKALPAYDEGVCISPEAIMSAAVAESKGGNISLERITDNRAATVNRPAAIGQACASSLKFTKRAYLRNKYDYVIRIKCTGWRAGASPPSDSVSNEVSVIRVLWKRGRLLPSLKSGASALLWTIEPSHCPHFRKGKEYLVACYADPRDGRLRFDPRRCMVARWREGWTQTVREWNRLVEGAL